MPAFAVNAIAVVNEPTVWDRLVRIADQRADLAILDPDATAAVGQSFAAEDVADPNSRWWWSSLKPGVVERTIDYGDSGVDPFEILHQWVPSNLPVVLLVTDEEPVPRGAIAGPIEGLLDLIRATPFFEYVVTDEAAS